jgi:hypothetical protein
MGGMDNDTSIGLASEAGRNNFYHSRYMGNIQKEYRKHPKAQFIMTLKQYAKLGKTKEERWDKAFRYLKNDKLKVSKAGEDYILRLVNEGMSPRMALDKYRKEMKPKLVKKRKRK